MKAIDIIKDLSMFIILVLLQALVLNSITLFGVAVPILYIYFIIKQPLGRNRFYVILSAFLIGLVIDMFLNTPGVNAAATTIVATLRSLLVFILYPKNEIVGMVPSIRNGALAFVKYTIVMVLLHQIFLFTIDAITLFNLNHTLIRIASSSALTVILIIASDSLFFRKGRISG